MLATHPAEASAPQLPTNKAFTAIFFSYPQRVDQISPVASTRSGPGSRSWQHLLVLEPYILARVLQSVYAIVAGRRSCHGCWPAAI